MNRRSELWKEIKKFCEYIENYFPRIQKIHLFGSCLWKKLPIDIDIGIEGSTGYLQDAYKQLFPNVQLFRYKPDATTCVLIWTRRDGMLVKSMPKIKRDVMIEELQNLRKQIKNLKQKIKTHTHYDPDSWGYFGPY